ncbi:MAG TPA: hypothetical protein VH914_20530 [Acidimicrobiia bacterium]|nr:hypothetical protein [Acidimicrobiia bacterium]
MGRRWVAALCALVAFCGACASTHDAARRGPVSRGDGWFVPKPLPRGWKVASASAARYRPPAVTNGLYAPGGTVAANGPALLAGVSGGDDAMPLGETGDCSVPGLGPAVATGDQNEQCPSLRSDRRASGYGHLHHFGPYTTLFWESDLEEDTAYYVAARGLTDTQLARIARSVRSGHAPSIPSTALPAGWKRTASAPPLPRQTRSAPLEVDLVAPGNRWTYVLAYRLSSGAATIDEFVAGLQRASQNAELGFVSAERHFGSTTVLVTARAPSATLAAIGRSIVPADEHEWKQLQAAK